METISYHLPAFEGPLDLLLFLVQKNKLNIYDIPIAEVLQQYLDTINQMKDIDLDVATEFLDMAARLVQIKSSMLLPKHEEAEVMRLELVGELIEYQLCQEAARRLAIRNIGGDIFVRDPADIEPDMTYRRLHAPSEILEAYLSAAGRGRRRLPPPAQAFSGIVSHHIVSVSSKIVFVLRHLYQQSTVTYRSLFEAAENKSELVATFLALLELVKSNRICVEGDGEQQCVRMLNREDITEENLNEWGQSAFDEGAVNENEIEMMVPELTDALTAY